MKIALIGGGGARTPAVVYALARRWADVPVEQVALYDIDQQRVDAYLNPYRDHLPRFTQGEP